jgi:hypothetical protein
MVNIKCVPAGETTPEILLMLPLCACARVKVNYFTHSFLHTKSIRTATMCNEVCSGGRQRFTCETKNVETLNVFLEPMTE